MTARGVLRSVKNYTKGYSPIQMKVREATSNDLGGPSGTLMSTIAQATYNQHEFLEVMEMLDKRLNDKGKNWRHVFKALTVLDYCLHCGSEQVLQYSIDNIYIVKTLKEFQHVDDSGRDQGANVRQKAREVTSLLLEPSKLRDERKNRNWMNGRMGFNDPNAAPLDQYGSRQAYGNNAYSYSTRNVSRYQSNAGNASSGPRRNSFSNPDYRYADEDREMKEAIAASKREAVSRAVPRGYDEDAELKKAIEESAKEAKESEVKNNTQSQGTSSARGGTGTNAEVDLLGGLDDFNDIANNNNNMGGMPNGSMAGFNQQQMQIQQQQLQQFSMAQNNSSSAANDLLTAFGNTNQMPMMSNANATQFNAYSASTNNFGTVSGAGGDTFDPFGLNNNNNMQTQTAGFNGAPGFGNSPYGAGAFVSQPNLTGGAANPFGGNSSMNNTNTSIAAANPFGQSSTMITSGQQTTNTVDLLSGAGTGGTFDGASGTFGSAFDGGASAKPLPFGASTTDPNSRLAEIARNSDKIDPFATIAMGGASNPPSNPFGGAPANSVSQLNFNTNTNTTAGSSFLGMNNMMGNGATTGGSSLVDLSPAALTAGPNTTNTNNFGQINRNPFATAGATPAQSNKQPSLNQLMSTNSSNNFNSANMNNNNNNFFGL